MHRWRRVERKDAHQSLEPVHGDAARTLHASPLRPLTLDAGGQVRLQSPVGQALAASFHFHTRKGLLVALLAFIHHTSRLTGAGKEASSALPGNARCFGRPLLHERNLWPDPELMTIKPSKAVVLPHCDCQIGEMDFFCADFLFLKSKLLSLSALKLKRLEKGTEEW